MKVTVLGAGPAGSTAAYYLAKGGASVELIDKVEFPRDKPCAGGLFNPLLFEKEFPHVKKFPGKYCGNRLLTKEGVLKSREQISKGELPNIPFTGCLIYSLKHTAQLTGSMARHWVRHMAIRTGYTATTYSHKAYYMRRCMTQIVTWIGKRSTKSPIELF